MNLHGAVVAKMQVPDEIVAALRAAVLASPMVEQDIKDLL